MCRKERTVCEQQIQSKLCQLEEAEEAWRRKTEEQWREVGRCWHHCANGHELCVYHVSLLQTMAQAEMLALQHTDFKRAKAREMRASRADDHAANLARVQSEEEEKLALVKEELEVKARKSRELLCSKENAIRQVGYGTT